MFNEELRGIIWEVITSWQVIAITFVIIIYITIVKKVARTYRSGKVSVKMPKMPKAPKAAPAPGPLISESDNLDEAEDLE